MQLSNYFFLRNKSLVILLFLFFINVFAFHAQQIKPGMVDLRGVALLDKKMVDVSGEWQFYYGKHLSAEQMKQLDFADKLYIKVPFNWKNILVKGRKLPVWGMATYYLQIIVDHTHAPLIFQKSYGLTIGNITSAYKLWVNDQLVGSTGNATRSRNGFRPMYLPQTCCFTSTSDTLNVVLQVSNFFDVNYAGISENIYFGTKDKAENLQLRRNIISIFVLCAFVWLFLFQLSHCFAHSEEKSHIIIALLSVIFFMKMLLDGNILIFHFFPDLNFILCYRFWLLSFLSIPLIFRLTKLAFPLDMNHSVEKGIITLYLILGVLFLTADINFLLNHIFWVIYFSFACVLYLFYVLIKAVVNRRHYSIIHIVSFLVMGLTMLNDLVYVTNQLTIGYLSQIGVCFYVMMQSTVLSLKFARSHRRVLQLSEELENTNRNLEGIVVERTKALQEANVELSKVNKQKDFLISTITHDLMGSFNTLLTFTKSLSTDAELSEKHRNLMSMLYRASERGFLILDNVLAWARLQLSNKSEMTTISNLSGLVTENLQLYGEKLEAKAITIETAIDNSLLFQCNKNHLSTILRNLISNAIKFSKNGGRILISNSGENGFMRIVVHDEGIGMTDEVRKTIFDTEKKSKHEGTAGERGAGLGLVIVKALVENNHGCILCYSQPDEGTDFIVEFPRLTVELNR